MADIAEDSAETAYWRFNARCKGFDKWKGAPQSERDAFKGEYRTATAKCSCDGLVQALKQMIEAINTGNIDSPDIGGEPEVCGHSHKWHEEWLYHTQQALEAHRKQRGNG